VKHHIKLLESTRVVLQVLVNDERMKKNALPTLLHPDLHMRNIFVDETDASRITGIIDWQSASIVPAFMYDDIPDFAATHYPSADNTELAVQVSEPNKAELCAIAFDACIKGLVPRLESVRALDEDLLRLLRYCHRTWKDGIAALQEELIVLSRRWAELGLPDECPYSPPTDTALQEHRQQYHLFVTSLKLKKDLIEILNTDSTGWVSNEAFEEARETEEKIFAQLASTVAQEPDADMTVDDLRRMWPFDGPK